MFISLTLNPGGRSPHHQACNRSSDVGKKVMMRGPNKQSNIKKTRRACASHWEVHQPSSCGNKTVNKIFNITTSSLQGRGWSRNCQVKIWFKGLPVVLLGSNRGSCFFPHVKKYRFFFTLTQFFLFYFLQ